MAIAVMGGLITSTALTLVIVPAVFTLVDDVERWIGPRVSRVLISHESRPPDPLRRPHPHAVSWTTMRPAWWVRFLAALPWWVMNPFADALAWLSWRVVQVEQKPLRANLMASFPELTEAQLQQMMRDYYRSFAQVLVEVLRSVSLTPEELRRRVVLEDIEPVRAALAAGSPVLLVAAHQCNWEWMLLALSLQLGYPLEAAYKPLVDGWAQQRCSKPAVASAPGWYRPGTAAAYPARRAHPARHCDGGRPGAAHQRAPALDPLPEPRYGLLHGCRGNHPRHQIPRVLSRAAPHRRGHYTVSVTPLAQRGREAAHRGADRALCTVGGGADSSLAD